MKTICLFAIFLTGPLLYAQGPGPGPNTTIPHMGPGPGKKFVMTYRHDMGKWWQNSDVAKKLQLSDDQINQLDQVFYQHRLKLIDNGAEMEKEDLRLQNLLDADVPNEGQISAQVDQVLSARGKLEREYTTMNLDLRKVLSLDQWRQLKTIRREKGGFGDRVFFQRIAPAERVPMGAGRGPGPVELPPLPPDPDGVN